jgi:hypothetical protein
MRISSKAAGLSVALVATLALAGCVQPPAPVIPTSEPRSTPVFKSDAAALAAAKKALDAYLVASDRILIDGGRGSNLLQNLATPTVQKEDEKGFAEFASKGWHSTGGTSIDAISLQSYSPSTSRDAIAVYACLDVSKVDVLDSKGDSVVSPSRPSLQQVQVTFDVSRTPSLRLLVSSEGPWSGSRVCP